MSTKNDGGTAFPTPHECLGAGCPFNDGMSLRQWFAGKALQGMFAAESENNGYSDLYMGTDGKPTYRRTMYPIGENGAEDYTKTVVQLSIHRTKFQVMATDAFAAADAMIEEGDK